MFRQPFKRRPYRHIERRYIVEYVNRRFPERIATFYNMRLGPAPAELYKRYPELPESYFKVWMPTADAVVVTKTHIYVVEAKIRNPRQGLGQLQDYVRRVPYTRELKRFMPRPVEAILVIPLKDPELEKTCVAYGIVVDYYTPGWVIDYLKEVKLLPR